MHAREAVCSSAVSHVDPLVQAPGFGMQGQGQYGAYGQPAYGQGQYGQSTQYASYQPAYMQQGFGYQGAQAYTPPTAAAAGYAGAPGYGNVKQFSGYGGALPAPGSARGCAAGPAHLPDGGRP